MEQMEVLNTEETIKAMQTEDAGEGTVTNEAGHEKESGPVQTTDSELARSGVEKLKKERDSYLAMVKGGAPAVMTQAYEMLFSALIQKCEADADFDTKVGQEQKTWPKAMQYASDKVKESLDPSDEQKRLARAGQPIMASIDMDTMVSYVEAYYMLDDRAEYEKEKLEKKKRMEKLEEAKKKAQTKTSKEPATKKADKAKGKNDGDQMFLFDILG